MEDWQSLVVGTSSICSLRPLTTDCAPSGAQTSPRTGHHALASELKRGNGLFASNGRKLPEKLVQRVAALDVVEERLDRDASADEHGRSAQNLRVAVYDWRFVGHGYLRASLSLALGKRAWLRPVVSLPLHQSAAHIVPWNRGLGSLNVFDPAPVQFHRRPRERFVATTLDQGGVILRDLTRYLVPGAILRR